MIIDYEGIKEYEGMRGLEMSEHDHDWNFNLEGVNNHFGNFEVWLG